MEEGGREGECVCVGWGRRDRERLKEKEEKYEISGLTA